MNSKCNLILYYVASHDAFAMAYEIHKSSTRIRNENFQCYPIRIAKQSRSSSPLFPTYIR